MCCDAMLLANMFIKTSRSHFDVHSVHLNYNKMFFCATQIEGGTGAYQSLSSNVIFDSA